MVLRIKNNRVGLLMLNKFLKCLLKFVLPIKILDLCLSVSKTFGLITLGFTWTSFALGSLSWWGPIFLEKAHLYAYDSEDPKDKEK